MEQSDNQTERKRQQMNNSQTNAPVLTKKQRLDSLKPLKDAKGRIIEAVNKKNANEAYKCFEIYCKYESKVDANIFSLLFRSLTTADDIPILDKWMNFITEHDIKLGENAYTCRYYYLLLYIAIIQFFCSIGNEEKAIEYLLLILDHGMKLKFRNYLPILQSVSNRGDIDSMRSLIQHMRENSIPFDEDVYYYELLACLRGHDAGLFIVCLKEMMKSVEIIQNKKTIDLFTEFASIYSNWLFKPCIISDTGLCDVCSKQLSRFPLSLQEKHELAASIEDVIIDRSKEDKNDCLHNFSAFKQFLIKNGPYDIFLDGANIAHYKQNFNGGCFNYDQIQMVIDYLLKQKKRILIVLHEHHFNQKSTTLPDDWLEQKLAYKVTKGNNDDLYWMYAALSADNDAMILSNDQMRDHFFHIHNDARFQKWREHNQIYYDMWSDAEKKKFVFKYPLGYTQKIQEHRSGFHIPFGAIKENMKTIEQFYCLINTDREQPDSLIGTIKSSKKCSIL